MEEAFLKKRIGKHIRKRRKELKWSQAKLAEESGLDDKNIGKIENGGKAPQTLTLFKLTIAMDLDLNTVFKEIQHEYEQSNDK